MNYKLQLHELQKQACCFFYPLVEVLPSEKTLSVNVPDLWARERKDLLGSLPDGGVVQYKVAMWLYLVVVVVVVLPSSVTVVVLLLLMEA